MNITVGIFGDQEVAARLGKKGTINDIALYNHASSEGIFTFACPNSEKIQPLLQVVNMIDVPVLVVRNFTKDIGEIIIALDAKGFDKGFIITELADTLSDFIKGTRLENFEIIDEKQLWPKLLDFKVERDEDFLLVPVDNYFNVKGIGTVVLGIVRSGKLVLHDKLLLEPLGREVIVKGIQSNDKDIKEAPVGTRVGVNLRDVEAKEIKRGFVLCRSIEKTNEINIDFKKNKFFKQELKEGISVLISVGLQVVSCKVESAGDVLKLRSEQPIAFTKKDKFIIASQNDIMPRIIGSGSVL